jgi:hypothetical protein
MMKSGQAVASLTAHDGDRGMLLFMRENAVSAAWQSGGDATRWRLPGLTFLHGVERPFRCLLVLICGMNLGL